MYNYFKIFLAKTLVKCLDWKIEVKQDIVSLKKKPKRIVK